MEHRLNPIYVVSLLQCVIRFLLGL